MVYLRTWESLRKADPMASGPPFTTRRLGPKSNVPWRARPLGEHSYALDAGQVAFSPGPFALENPVLVAQFLPFGATGMATSLSKRQVSGHPQVVGRGASGR